MLAQMFRAAKVRLRRLPTRVRGGHATRVWFRDCWFASLRLGASASKGGLSPEQLEQFERKGYFDVTGCHSGRRYRIGHGTAMNIHEIDGAGRPGIGWCFVPNTYLVAGDVMLAQKIALETDERAALAVAKSFSPKGAACICGGFRRPTQPGRAAHRTVDASAHTIPPV
jgi:hypothetical protein